MKPDKVESCKYIKTCDSAQLQGCMGCNVWNYLYDIKALQKWCRENGKDFMLFTMEMHRMLNTERSPCHDWQNRKEDFLAGLKVGQDMAEADLATVAYMQGAEAEEIADKLVEKGCVAIAEDRVRQDIQYAFKKGAEFGYNKANEYAKVIIQDLLDNSDEYARQRAIDWLEESEK